MKVGFIGLGMMGTAMAQRLLEQDMDLVVYNRTAAKAESLEQKSNSRVEVVKSPRAVLEKVKIFITMVANDRAVRDIVWSEDGGLLPALHSDHIWIDSSTISPNTSQEISKVVEEQGAMRLEAPVSGSVDAAQSGNLVMYVSGSEAAMNVVQEVLDHLTSRIEYIGKVGQALALKLAINLNIAAQMQGFVEGLMIAENAGIAKEKAIELMLNSVVASPMLKYRVPFALNPPEEPWFTIDLMLKDLNLALNQAAECHTALPTTSATANLFRAAVRSKMGQEELGLMINFVRDWANPASTKNT